MNLMGRLRFESPPHLPSPHFAPILEYYDIETKRVDSDYQLAAPVDDRGVVDIYETVEQALLLVDPEYVWPRTEPKPDMHHFVWERASYHPQEWGGSSVPRDYREIPFHKGYLPRGLHDFIHATIAPPPIPDFEVMRKRVEAYESAKKLFLAARRAIIFDRKPAKFKGVDRTANGEMILEQEILDNIYERMHNEFLQRKRSVYTDNEFICEIGLNDLPLETVARELGRIAAHDGINFLRKVYANRRVA